MLEALMKKKSDDGRFRYLYWVIIAIFAILVCRLAYLQLVEGEYYHAAGKNRKSKELLYPDGFGQRPDPGYRH